MAVAVAVAGEHMSMCTIKLCGHTYKAQRAHVCLVVDVGLYYVEQDASDVVGCFDLTILAHNPFRVYRHKANTPGCNVQGIEDP